MRDREREIREILRIDGSRIVVSGESEVERDLDVGRKLLLEQGEEVIIRNLGDVHWGLGDLPKGH